MPKSDADGAGYLDGGELESLLSYQDGRDEGPSSSYSSGGSYADVAREFFRDRSLEPLRTWEQACELYRGLACQKGLPTYNPGLGASAGLAHTYIGGRTTTDAPGDVVVSPATLQYGAAAVAQVLMHEGYHVMGMASELQDYFLQYEAPFLASHSGYLWR